MSSTGLRARIWAPMVPLFAVVMLAGLTLPSVHAQDDSVTTVTPRGWPHLLHPVTGKPYTKEEIDRLKYLRAMFPDNVLLPKTMSAEQEAEWKARVENQDELAQRMAGGTATREEIADYYDLQEQFVQARLELVNFVLSEPQWGEKIRGRYQRIRDNSLKQLEEISASRQESIKILERREQGGEEPPPPPLATISPKSVELTQGETARFEAQLASGASVELLTWILPTRETAHGMSVEFSTITLEPGLYRVSLQAQATGNLSVLTVDTALLEVKPGIKPKVDLELETLKVFTFPPDFQELGGKAALQAVVRNRGADPVAGATLFFAADGLIIQQIADIKLQPNERQAFVSDPLTPEQIENKAVTATIFPADPKAEAFADNNSATLTVANLPPPPDTETVLDGGLRYEAPPWNNVNIPSPTLVLNNFVTQVFPLPIDLGPVLGYADLHIHQMADLGYDGRLVWGSHDGTGLSTAVPQCLGTNHAICWMPSLIAEGFHGAEMGSHAGLLAFVPVTCAPPAWIGGPFELTKGWHSNPDKSFERWPVWSTITHQQVYREWLETAHQDGLRLMVMSAVNFSGICGLIPFFHGYGNHPLDDVIPQGLTPEQLAVDRAIVQQLPCQDMRNVRRQLLAAWEFANKYDWYEIALTPGHAAQIIQEGKLAVVLSVEATSFMTADTVEEMRAQLDYYVNGLGVRSIQPIHQLNNQFGGTSYFDLTFDIVQAIVNVANIIGEILSTGQLDTVNDLDTAVSGIIRGPTGDNTQPLTPLGLQLLLDSMDQGLLIDLAHMDRVGTTQAYNVAKVHGNYPLFVSHVRYQDLLVLNPSDDHLAKSWDMIQDVKELNGMVGLRTSAGPVRSYAPSLVSGDCPGSTRSFAQSYALGALGYGIPQAFASDMNGFIQQTRPRFHDPNHPKYDSPGWACSAGIPDDGLRAFLQSQQGNRFTDGTGSDFDLTGFGHIGQIGDFLTDLFLLGVDTAGLKHSADSFVQMWLSATLPIPRTAQSRCIDRSGIGGGPSTGGPLQPDCP